MKITSAQAEKLFKGSFSFTQLGFSMLITRLKNIYLKDNSTIEKSTGEINIFLKKFSAYMDQDCELIGRL